MTRSLSFVRPSAISLQGVHAHQRSGAKAENRQSIRPPAACLCVLLVATRSTRMILSGRARARRRRMPRDPSIPRGSPTSRRPARGGRHGSLDVPAGTTAVRGEYCWDARRWLASSITKRSTLSLGRASREDAVGPEAVPCWGGRATDVTCRARDFLGAVSRASALALAVRRRRVHPGRLRP